jgi:hypothetical protein
MLHSENENSFSPSYSLYDSPFSLCRTANLMLKSNGWPEGEGHPFLFPLQQMSESH